MFCSKCGAENADGAKFCSKCGFELGTSVGVSSEAESSTGLSANVAGLLCYVLGWITGIIFIVLEKKSTYVRFHAWQSIMVFGVLTAAHLILSTILGGIAVATFSPGLAIFASVIGTIIWILIAILWIILVIQAGTGKMWKVPGAGDWAERQAHQ